MLNSILRFSRLAVLCLVAAATAFSQVRISQVYGGGQSNSAIYAWDYVELFNAGSSDVSLDLYAIQYQAAGSTGNWSGKILLTGKTIGAKKYFLVQTSPLSTAITPGAALPVTPDVISTSIGIAAAAGKVALTSNSSTISTTVGPPAVCPSGGAVADLVGYGTTANCGEAGTIAPAPSIATAIYRAGGGCIDTDSNSADFSAAAAAPRNSSSSSNSCTAMTNPSGSGSGTPNPVGAGNVTLITLNVSPGANPTSTGLTATADLSPIGGSTTQTLFDNGTNGDVTAGDNIFSYSATVAGGTTGGSKAIAFAISDAQSRTAMPSLNLTVTAPVPITPISQIQGSGIASTYVGQTVQTTGIVTLRKSNGFYMQTPDNQVDSDPNTSEGILVFTNSAPPAAAVVGASVQVTGIVTEFKPSSQRTEDSNSLTELASPTVFQFSTGNTLPTPITLNGSSINPALGFGQLERYEGMRVQFASLTATAPTGGTVSEPNANSASNGRFYAVPTGIARPFREPGIQIGDPLPLPGIPRWDGNLEIFEVNFNMPGDTALEVTSNAVINNFIGVLDYFSPFYALYHDPGTTATASGLMSVVPVSGAGANELAVAAFNIERFFDTVDDSGVSDVALSAPAFNNRLNKLSLAVRNVLKFPDVISFEEAENLTTLQAIATKINNDAVAAGQTNPNYSAYLSEGNDVGGIDVGFLVKGALTLNSVTQIGKSDTYTDPSTGTQAILFDRPPLVADVTASGLNLKIISVHLRSLNGVDTQDSSGNRVRVKRASGAERLAQYMQAYQAAGGNVIVLGDFNAFEFSDGYGDIIGTLKGTPTPAANVQVASPDLLTPDFLDLMETRLTAGVNRYSYVFGGSAQVLDHILVSASLNPRVNRLEVARMDADFPETYRGDSTRPERLSDHDIPVVYISLPPPAALTTASPNTGTQGATNLSVALTGANTNFVQGSTTASFGAGITANNLTVNSATSATASITIDGAAATGLRNVTVSTGGEVVTLVNGFTVNPPPQVAPIVTLNPTNVSVLPNQTASFTAAASGFPAPTVQWQSSTDGVNFANIGGATSTTYSFSAQLADTNKSFRAVFTNVVNSATSSAATLKVGTTAFGGFDSTTQGTWPNKYGADGYFIANGAFSVPSYATVTVGKAFSFPAANAAAAFTWSGQSAEARALLNGANASTRIAATYIAPDYSNNFQIKIAAKDANRHQVALYLLDWDTTLRNETLTLTDGAGNVLDVQSAVGFSNGKYAVWSYQGDLTITVTGNVGSPVVSGIFFDPVVGATPQPSFTLGATAASANVGSSGSSTVTVTPANGFNSAVTLAASAWPAGITGTFGTNPTANASSVTINVAASVAPGQYSLIVNGVSGVLSATTNIALTVNVLAPPHLTISASGATIAAGASGSSTLTQMPFPAGDQWNLSLSTPNWPAGISPGVRNNFTLPINVAANVTPGFYSLPLSATNGTETATASISLTVIGVTSTTASATFNAPGDTISQGTWTNKYGSDGYRIANGASNLPAYALLNTNGAPTFPWASQTNDLRALQIASGSASRIASTFYGNNTFNLNLTDGGTHQVALYMIDWDSTSRAQRIDILDAANDGLLNSQSFSGFNGGLWASWNIKGNVKIRVTATGSGDGTISGFFFGPATGAPPPPDPSFTLSATAASVATGSSGTSTVLVVPANGFNSQVNLATSNWPAGITGSFVPNPSANTSTATITVGSNVSPGPYLLTVNGNSGTLNASTTIALTVTTGANGSSSASFAGLNTTTQGNWPGTFGSQGYFISNGPSAPLTYAAANVSGQQQVFTWTGQTTDPRALKLAPGSPFGIASAFLQYPGNAFNLNVSISDNAAHNVSLYLLDWDGTGTAQTITVLDAVTGAVLDTQSFKNFQSGQYASWNIRGSVIFRISGVGSSSPALSGVFFN